MGFSHQTQPTGFRKRLETAVQNYPGNIPQLSKEASVGPSTIYDLLKNQRFDHSKTGPGIFLMARISKLCGVSLDYLAGLGPPPMRAEYTNGPVTADRLLRTHFESGADYEAFLPYLELCDEYEPCAATDTKITPLRLGSSSLAAMTFGNGDLDTLRATIEHVDNPALKMKWVKDYANATQAGFLVSYETINFKLPTQPKIAKMDYIRTLLCVGDAQGDRRILNFCTAIVTPHAA